MKTYTHTTTETLIPRSHPWTQALADPSHRYYDLKAEPAKIRTALEDLLNLGTNPATETFYGLLEWLNGPQSALESNDCGARPLRPNKNPTFPKNIECTARLMILFRDLEHNLSVENTSWLEGAMQHYLLQIDTDFAWGVVGTTLVPATFVTLPLPESMRVGKQLLLSFWAWGDDETEVWANLARVFSNTETALKEVSREVLLGPTGA